MFPFDHCGCSRSLRFDFLISRQKTIARGWRILCMCSYVSASLNTVSFELFVIHEIHSVLRSHSTVASIVFSGCFQIVQVMHP